MSEERKPEESLMSDETLFFGYAKAAVTGLLAFPSAIPDLENIGDNAARIAFDQSVEHRKRFPKKLDKK